MFIVQVMYAESLVKILHAILRVNKHEQQNGSTYKIRHEIELLTSAAAILAELPDSEAMTAVQKQLTETRLALQKKTELYSADLALLERCGIKYGEYEEKFRRISSDCLRISHNSVKPPAWETVRPVMSLSSDVTSLNQVTGEA